MLRHSIRENRPVPKVEQDRVMLCVWTAFRCMKLGTAGREEWSHLADALNIVEAMCHIGKLDFDKFIGFCCRAQSGLHQAVKSGDSQMKMEGEALDALAEVCTQYDLCLMKFSAGTLEAAKLEFLRRLQQTAIYNEAVKTGQLVDIAIAVGPTFEVV